MKTMRGFSLLTFALALTAGSSNAADGGSGEVSLRNSQWQAVDTVAFMEGEELRVAFSDEPFDRDAMRKDGKLNIFDVLRHSGQTVTLSFGGNTPSGCFDFYVRAGDVQSSGSQCEGDLNTRFSDVRNDARQARGAVDWSKGNEKIALRWDVPILSP